VAKLCIDCGQYVEQMNGILMSGKIAGTTQGMTSFLSSVWFFNAAS
jgi:hypothetical protein